MVKKQVNNGDDLQTLGCNWGQRLGKVDALARIAPAEIVAVLDPSLKRKGVLNKAHKAHPTLEVHGRY